MKNFHYPASEMPRWNRTRFRTSIVTGGESDGSLWRDPEFDVAKPAIYYARVLEIPTPRWSTLVAVRNYLPLSPYVAPTIQERAWSFPIWYTPAKSSATR